MPLLTRDDGGFAPQVTQVALGQHRQFGFAQAVFELLAIRDGGATRGMIALGSEDSARFYAGMGTIYLERLGEMAAAALARVLG